MVKHLFINRPLGFSRRHKDAEKAKPVKLIYGLISISPYIKMLCEVGPI